MTPGNHDFNYGQDRLVELAGMTNFPIISANVVKADGTTLLAPYTIKEVDGLKVGIFGLSTPETAYKTNPKNVEGLTFENPIEVAQKMVDELKSKVDIIVALAHLGLDESSEFTSEKVANEVDGIDVIVDGHSHSLLENGMVVGNTLIVQAGELDKNLGVVNLTIKDGKISNKSARLFTKDEAANITEDADIATLIADTDKENEKITSVVVGKTDVLLDGVRDHVRAGETNLGNLITDAMINASGADIAITNGGGMRASIEPGEITKGDVITVLPFGNYVVVKEVKGSAIKEALELGVSAYPATLGAFAHVGGMTFKFDPDKEVGNRVFEVKVNGTPLDPDKTYKVATNDFMAVGGDGYEMFSGTPTVVELPGLDEVLISYIQQLGTVNVEADGRIQVGSATTETAPATDTTVEPAPTTTTETYIIVPGDVLWKIAQKFGLTWEVLAKFNNLKNPNYIFPGQKLLIPAN